MFRTTSLGTTAVYLRAALLILVLLSLVFVLSGRSLAREATTASDSKRVFLFNMSPEKTFSIKKNSILITSANSSLDGVTYYADQSVFGDLYEISESGATPLPPSAPAGLSAQGDDIGCGQLQWISNAEGDVDYYRVYYGSASVEGGSASSYDDSVDVSGATDTYICGLRDGTWYFSVRAHNTAGLLSALSLETSASVSNGSTQPPSPPLLLGASEGDPGCIDVVWIPSGSPDVTGYVVDYGTQSVEGGAVSYDFSLDAGNTGSFSICQLTEGRYYFAVRARNFAGMLSAYSGELSADVNPTAVFINAFSGEALSGGVELAWRISADETIEGYSIRRIREGDTREIVLNDGYLVDPERVSWRDETVAPVTTYLYSLVVVGENNVEYRSPSVSVTTLPMEMLLDQNVPNPFNPSTAISFVVPQPSRTRVTVYDVSGALVKTLFDEVVSAGRRTVQWDGTNSTGERVSSGAYFYRLITDNKSTTRKMLLLK
jgi:hypothetical protein